MPDRAGYATGTNNPVAYPGAMTDKLDRYRDELRSLAEEQALAKTLPQRRTAAVAKARKAGMTWREAAQLLGMTEHGLIKAQKPKTEKPKPS